MALTLLLLMDDRKCFEEVRGMRFSSSFTTLENEGKHSSIRSLSDFWHDIPGTTDEPFFLVDSDFCNRYDENARFDLGHGCYSLFNRCIHICASCLPVHAWIASGRHVSRYDERFDQLDDRIDAGG